jgi:hypothetical protein
MKRTRASETEKLSAHDSQRSSAQRFSALVIAFPQIRRVHFIAKAATSIARAPTRQGGENILAEAVRRQRTSMMRKGVHSDRVDRECQMLERAIRTRVWGLILTPNDVG